MKNPIKNRFISLLLVFATTFSICGCAAKAVPVHAAEHADRLATLAQLPDSCVASADCLDRQRKVFEEYGVFSPAMIDGIIAELRAFDDTTLRKNIEGYQEEIQKLVTRYFHCG